MVYFWLATSKEAMKDPPTNQIKITYFIFYYGSERESATLSFINK